MTLLLPRLPVSQRRLARSILTIPLPRIGISTESARPHNGSTCIQHWHKTWRGFLVCVLDLISCHHISFHFTRQFWTTTHRDIFAMSTTLAICGQSTAEVHFSFTFRHSYSPWSHRGVWDAVCELHGPFGENKKHMKGGAHEGRAGGGFTAFAREFRH